MGLTRASSGGALLSSPIKGDPHYTVALAGNPNVGKSTVFNGLTGLRQHTGNWSGKTVSAAWGRYSYKGQEYTLVDIPGAYSLLSLSAEEQAARDYICFGGAQVTVIVCDATCLERNLDLVLQILEVTSRAVLAVNLMDEANLRGIYIDTEAVSQALSIPVVAMDARRKKGFDELKAAITGALDAPALPKPPPIEYSPQIEAAVSSISRSIGPVLKDKLDARWASLRLLEGSPSLLDSIDEYLGFHLQAEPHVAQAFSQASELLRSQGIDGLSFRDQIVSAIYAKAGEISGRCVRQGSGAKARRQLKIDCLLTRRSTGMPVMLLLLSLIFFITIEGANFISGYLQYGLNQVGRWLDAAMIGFGAPGWLRDPLINGVWLVLSWVVAVMLPPMAIFFPLFTFLEDLGYLPRLAFTLDESFRRAGSCGKQALTMCMGFGCNAAGVVGCRVISSPRERVIAAVTNSFVPCNGRFPPPVKWQIYALSPVSSVSIRSIISILSSGLRPISSNLFLTISKWNILSFSAVFRRSIPFESAMTILSGWFFLIIRPPAYNFRLFCIYTSIYWPHI